MRGLRYLLEEEDGSWVRHRRVDLEGAVDDCYPEGNGENVHLLWVYPLKDDDEYLDPEDAPTESGILRNENEGFRYRIAL